MGLNTSLFKPLCMGAMCVALGLSAETLTWKGGSAGSLGTAANWTPEQIPQDGDVLVFPNTVGAVTAVNDLAVTLGGLNLASTGAFVLNGTEPLRLNGLVTSSASIASSAKSYPSDRINCPVELVGNTHFNLTGVPVGVSNPSVSACRNLDIYGCVGGIGDLVVSNRVERGVSLRLYCQTNTYTGRTVLRSFGTNSGRNYAGISVMGSLTNGPSCLGMNRQIDIRGRFSFDVADMIVDRDFVLPWGDAAFQVNKSGGCITANSTISCPAGGTAQVLEFRNTSLTIDAYLSNVQIARNDTGWIYFTNPTNDIRNPNLAILEGTFVAKKLAPRGLPSSLGSVYTKITLGKNSASTSAGLGYNGDEDATIDAPIKLDSLGFTGSAGARIDNLTAGTTLTVAGDIGVNATARPHQRLHLRGVGDGILSGNIEKGVHFVKEDAGTWTINSPTVATTGAVEVAQGTLLVNSAIADASSVTVAANATLGGSGTIAAPVVFSAGARLKAGPSPLVFTGAVSFPSTMTVDTSDVPAGAVRTVFTCSDAASQAALANVGFVPTDSGALATVENGALMIRRKGSFFWTGATDTVWNTSTANWRTEADESAVYVNEENAFFTDDATPADRCAVSVAEGVRAANITMGGTNDYSFAGAPFTVLGTLEKGGTGKLSLNVGLDAGLIHVTEGVFSAQANADFGTSPLSVESLGVHSLYPGKPIAGAISLGKRFVSNTVVTVSGQALAAENGGPVSLVPGSYGVNFETELRVTSPAVVTNRTLLCTSGGGRVMLRYRQTADTKQDFAWLGDIVCANEPMVYIHGPDNSAGGNLVIGELGRTVITGACALLSFRQGNANREIVVNSHIDVASRDGCELNVYARVRFMTPSNRWTSAFLNINSGTAILEANDALDSRRGLLMGTSDKGSAKSHAYSVVDLNGHDQTVTHIYDDSVSSAPWSVSCPNSNCWQIIRSAAPATLTISDDKTETRLRFPHTQITGAVSVVKSGVADMKLYQPNFNTGSWILNAGTTTLLDSPVQGAQWGGSDYHGTFGTSTNIVVGSGATLAFSTARAAFAKDARLTVEAGGKIQMDADQVVDYLTVDGRVKKSGTYTAAKNPDFVQGSGTLTVRVGDGGTILVFR